MNLINILIRRSEHFLVLSVCLFDFQFDPEKSIIKKIIKNKHEDRDGQYVCSNCRAIEGMVSPKLEILLDGKSE